MRLRILNAHWVLAAVVFIGLPVDSIQGEPVKSFEVRFTEAARAGDDAAVTLLIEMWRAAEPQNAKVFELGSDYYFHKSRHEPFKDFKTNFDNPDFDRALMSRAIDLQREAVLRFPARIDLRMRLVLLEQTTGDFDAEFAVFKDALAYAAAHKGQLRSMNGAEPDDFIQALIVERLQGSLNHYFYLKSPDAGVRYLRLAQLAETSFPKDPFPPLAFAGYYISKSRWAEARPYLEKAQGLDPTSFAVTLGFGDVYAGLHDNARAKAYYEKALASADADGLSRLEIEQRLAKLK